MELATAAQEKQPIQPQTNDRSTILRLPDELLGLVLSHCSGKDKLKVLPLVCRKIYQSLKKSAAWSQVHTFGFLDPSDLGGHSRKPELLVGSIRLRWDTPQWHTLFALCCNLSCIQVQYDAHLPASLEAPILQKVSQMCKQARLRQLHMRFDTCSDGFVDDSTHSFWFPLVQMLHDYHRTRTACGKALCNVHEVEVEAGHVSLLGMCDWQNEYNRLLLSSPSVHKLYLRNLDIPVDKLPKLLPWFEQKRVTNLRASLIYIDPESMFALASIINRWCCAQLKSIDYSCDSVDAAERTWGEMHRTVHKEQLRKVTHVVMNIHDLFCEEHSVVDVNRVLSLMLECLPNLTALSWMTWHSLHNALEPVYEDTLQLFWAFVCDPERGQHSSLTVCLINVTWNVTLTTSLLQWRAHHSQQVELGAINTDLSDNEREVSIWSGGVRLIVKLED